MKNYVIALGLMIALAVLSACTATPAAEVAQATAVPATAELTATPTEEPTATATFTPEPTATPTEEPTATATATPAATNTPKPTPTRKPSSGSGQTPTIDTVEGEACDMEQLTEAITAASQLRAFRTHLEITTSITDNPMPDQTIIMDMAQLSENGEVVAFQSITTIAGLDDFSTEMIYLDGVLYMKMPNITGEEAVWQEISGALAESSKEELLNAPFAQRNFVNALSTAECEKIETTFEDQEAIQYFVADVPIEDPQSVMSASMKDMDVTEYVVEEYNVILVEVEGVLLPLHVEAIIKFVADDTEMIVSQVQDITNINEDIEIVAPEVVEVEFLVAGLPEPEDASYVLQQENLVAYTTSMPEDEVWEMYETHLEEEGWERGEEQTAVENGVELVLVQFTKEGLGLMVAIGEDENAGQTVVSLVAFEE